MFRPRAMPCLLLQESSLIKTIQFKKEQYIGDPINAVRIYNQMEVDELIFFDVSASQRGNINFDLLENIASECFMPISYGGGVKTIADFKSLYSLGVEKVTLNTSAIETPNLIAHAANIFGSQSVLVVMDIKKSRWKKQYRVFSKRGKKPTHFKPAEYAKKIEQLGAGEIIVNSIDRDGAWDGFDIDLIKIVSDSVLIPVVACGGAGSLAHIGEVVKKGKASAVAIGSMAVFQAKGMGVLIKFPTKEELRKIFN